MFNKLHTQYGFGLIGIVIIIGVISIGAIALYFSQSTSKNITISLTPTVTTTPNNPSPTPDPYEGWKTYENQNIGFELMYPSDWYKILQESSIIFSPIAENEKLGVIDVSSLTVQVQSAVNVYSANDKADSTRVDATHYYELLSQYSIGEETLFLEGPAIGEIITNQGIILINGEKFLKVRFQPGENAPTGNFDWTSYYTLKNNKLIIITYSNWLNNEISEMEKIIHSLKLR